ncbi:MAG: T9SS type A sorting domain-containing protein [Bacteroidales bacterium]
MVGHLTGGEAICGHSVNDYFARFDIGYDLSDDMFKSLKAWLDPAQSGSQVLDGRDPYENNFSVSDTVLNYLPGDTLLTPYNLPFTGYTTGFNSDSLLGYSEFFRYTGTGYITEIRAMLGDMRYITATDSVTFYVFNESAGLPGDIVASKGITIKGTKDSLLLVIDFETAVTVNNNFFVGYRLWYTQPANSDSQQFAIYHTARSLNSENSAFFLDENGWHPFTEHPFDPSPASLLISAVVVKDAVYNTVIRLDKESVVKAYPNPFTDRINIIAPPGFAEAAEISLLDIGGRVIFKYRKVLSGEQSVTVPGNLNPGLYILTVRTNSEVYTFKLVR